MIDYKNNSYSGFFTNTTKPKDDLFNIRHYFLKNLLMNFIKAGSDPNLMKMMTSFEQKISFLEMQHKEALEREENLRKLNNSIMFAFSDIHKDSESLSSKVSHSILIKRIGKL